MTRLATGADNRGILRAVQRVTARLVIAPVLALGWGLAPAHAHRGDPDHHVQKVHRHLVPHQLGHHHPVATEIAEQDDDGVVWLNDAAIPQISYQPLTPLAVRIVLLDPEPSRPSWFPTAQDDSAPAHGPPRASLSFRGPPLSPA